MHSRLSLARCIAAGIFAVAAADLAAQVKWEIPPGGCAVFEERDIYHFHPVGKPKKRNAVPLVRNQQVPLLFASDLDKSKKRMREKADDLRWVVLYVAFDLGHARGGQVNVRFPWVDEFGDVIAKARIPAPDEDGWQRFDLDLTTAKVRRGDEDERMFAYWQDVIAKLEMKGTLHVERRVDTARGVVAHVRATGDLDCTVKKNGEKKVFHVQMDWRLQEVRENRGAGFEARVAESVRRAAKCIHEQISRRDPRDLTEDRRAGQRALALLALLHAEYRPTDTILRARLKSLREMEITETYSLSLAILVLEKLYAPHGEREALLSGRQQEPFPRKPSAEDMVVLQKWTKRLLDNRDSRVDPAYVSRWGYGRPGYDNSNTQFALLALHAASMCGIEISRGVWHGAARHFLESQHAGESTRPLRLPLVSHNVAKKQEHPHMIMKSAASSTGRGFSYRGPEDLPYGSMTAGGISSMTVCLAHLAKPGERPAAEAKDLQQARSDGFAWLWQNRGVRRNSGRDLSRHSYHWYYWLYSLERACELSRVAWIGDWDWYYEGAETIMARQERDGGFDNGSLIGDCFALLFLMQAQLPVLTGPRKR